MEHCREMSYPFPPHTFRKLCQDKELLCGGSNGFKKACKAFIKPSEVPQRSVKIKI